MSDPRDLMGCEDLRDVGRIEGTRARRGPNRRNAVEQYAAWVAQEAAHATSEQERRRREEAALEEGKRMREAGYSFHGGRWCTSEERLAVIAERLRQLRELDALLVYVHDASGKQ